MIRRFAILVPVALAACAPSVPDSGAGVGFQDYNTYIRNTYAPPPAAAAPAAPAPLPAPAFDPNRAADAIAAAEGTAPAAPPAGTRPRGNAPAGIKEESGELVHANPSISDEQDFAAVSARETIESDAERIRRNRELYVVVQPRDLPVRPGDTGPNIVEYALATTHDPGVQLHRRSSFGKKDPLAACLKFPSPDLAQQEFLARGGPDRDRLGLDPDGDGFACDWDPRPFRLAVQ